jgi:hypothetical protein
MSATKRHFRCVECGKKTSTTDSGRFAFRACVACRPTIATVPVKTKPPKAKPSPAAQHPEAVAAPVPPPVVEEAAVGKGKKVSALDAAAMVLRDARASMTPREIYDAILARNLWATKKGKTPDMTIAAAMGREIAAGGADCRFVKPERGKFAANPAVA